MSQGSFGGIYRVSARGLEFEGSSLNLGYHFSGSFRGTTTP